MRYIDRQACYQLGILPEYPKELEGFFPHLPKKQYVCWKWRPYLFIPAPSSERQKQLCSISVFSCRNSGSEKQK